MLSVTKVDSTDASTQNSLAQVVQYGCDGEARLGLAAEHRASVHQYAYTHMELMEVRCKLLNLQ